MRELERIYRDSGWHVYERARRILGSDDEAHDVVQDVFLRLADRWHEVRERDRMRAWVMRTTTNQCIDRLRLRKRHDPDAVDVIPCGGHVEGRLAARDQVLQLLGRLSVADQRICILRHMDGCTLDEIEQICGLTRKTVARRLAAIERKARRPARGGEDPS